MMLCKVDIYIQSIGTGKTSVNGRKRMIDRKIWYQEWMFVAQNFVDHGSMDTSVVSQMDFVVTLKETIIGFIVFLKLHTTKMGDG